MKVSENTVNEFADLIAWGDLTVTYSDKQLQIKTDKKWSVLRPLLKAEHEILDDQDPVRTLIGQLITVPPTVVEEFGYIYTWDTVHVEF